MLFFSFGRCFFLLYHIIPISKLPLLETLTSFPFGLILDISFSSYITLLIAFILPVFLLLKIKEALILKIIIYYTAFWIIIISFIFIVDAELFTFWGFRLDNTIFRYLGTAAEMLGTTTSSPLWFLIPFFILISYLGIILFIKFNGSYSFTYLKIWQIPFAFFLTAVLILPIRGGFQQIPNNESVAYYSTIPLLNQAALNPAWTLARSVIEQNGPGMEHYSFFDSTKAQTLFQQQLSTYSSIDTIPLKNTRPNIIVIIWESLTSKVLNDTVTPGLNQLKNQGIYFSNMYASGDRSDKGLVAILSAYPAQPDYSIMTEPGKSRKLPFITQQLKSAGYHTGYLYGGELEFANMRSYMNYNGFDEILGKSDFPKETWGAKWGAHDQFTFNRLLERVNEQSQKKNPFFYTLFTLSSHEPFDVPGKPALEGKSKSVQFKNSHHYADSCFTDFISKAQKETWWDNTWIIVVGDHGHILPGNEYAVHSPDEFHIPMVWLGGALTKQQEITKTYSQINIAPTIANYLHLNPSPFSFSKPIHLSDTTKSMAWYSFNDGYGSLHDKNHFFIYGLNYERIIFKKGLFSNLEVDESKAFLQVLMEDFYQK